MGPIAGGQPIDQCLGISHALFYLPTYYQLRLAACSLTTLLIELSK